MTQHLMSTAATSRVPRILGAETAEAAMDDHGLDDVYASAGYGRAAARDDEWMVAVADGWRLPFVTSGPDHARVAASPYGYGGLSIGEDVGADVAEALWMETRSAMHDVGIVSLFLRFPPFRSWETEIARTLPELEVRHVSDTVLVPTGTGDEMWAGLKKGCRSKVRKALRAGLTCDVEDFDPGDSAMLAEFRSIYDAKMEWLDAPASLRFDDRYYRLLSAGLRRPLMLVTVRYRGRAVASSLLMRDTDLLHDHLGASTDEGNAMAANNLMLWTAMEAAADEGLRGVHLGGGRRADDSLFRFKASFGGESLPFHVGRAIIDARRYDALVATRAAELGTTPDALRHGCYFPAFLANLPQDQR